MGYWVVRYAVTAVLRMMFRFDVQGREHVPRHGAVIVACNHNSFIDSLFLPMMIRRRVTFLAKAEYFDNPRTSWFFRSMGQIPVRRTGGSAGEAALEAGRTVLAQGGVLALYPEGTRSPDGRLYRGRTGVARMALDADVPVVPVAMTGTAAAQPVGSLVPRPGKRVRIRFGPALHWTPAPGEADREQLRAVTDDIMGAIAALSGQERVDDYAKKSRTDGASPGSGRPTVAAPGPEEAPVDVRVAHTPAPVAASGTVVS